MVELALQMLFPIIEFNMPWLIWYSWPKSLHSCGGGGSSRNSEFSEEYSGVIYSDFFTPFEWIVVNGPTMDWNGWRIGLIDSSGPIWNRLRLCWGSWAVWTRVEPSQAESDRAEPSRTEPSRVDAVSSAGARWLQWEASARRMTSVSVTAEEASNSIAVEVQ